MQPYPGLMVLYRPRPGQIRAGQVDLAAMVTAVYPGDRCDLNIYPPMSEPYQQPKVPALSEEFTSHVWVMPPAQEVDTDAPVRRGPGRPRKDEAA